MLFIAEETIEYIDSLPAPPAVVVFEDYGPIGKTSGKITARAEICGILKSYALRKLRVPIALVSPRSLKSYAVSNGNASKEEMLNKCNIMGYYPETSDEADAYFAARIGDDILYGSKLPIPFERINP